MACCLKPLAATSCGVLSVLHCLFFACQSQAKQMIHMEHEALFPKKKNK